MQTVLITGASRRLGLFLTRAFLDDGFRVIALTRSPGTELNALACDSLQIIETDYGCQASLQSAVEHIRQSSSSLRLLVHNASLFEKDAVHADDLYRFYDALYAVHMKLPAFLNESLGDLLHCEEDPGCIVHMTDIYAENPNPAFGLYCSTKAGLENLNKTYAKKYAPGIRVNAIAPGPLMFLPDHSAEDKAAVFSETLIKVESGFHPILQGIRFILDNRFITGTTLKIDGGRSIGKL
ncbi:SDR family NAD(P)-dependent oxidoreductase [Marinobacterium aestuariivivens]|uniref:SDR family NAD(P)-dependent oxidoreductase n=1 Tax=Marinobacterium aestuariivivens TaxID=1698799 RepID=A0ABW1ZYL8_9GAMM